jgi:ABC-type transport system involved in cytochrome bd biosynthesis fused ATPase/permease subunit
MDIEERLQRLQERYRVALSAAVVAKAQYFSMVGEPSVTRAALERASVRWQQIEARKRALVMRMAFVEQLARDLDEPRTSDGFTVPSMRQQA